MAKVIKSVVLVPGEKFTLPPGSKLLGSSNIGDLTSNCDIPTLEEIQCFVASFAADEDNGTTKGFYEGVNARIEGFRINGVSTQFDTPHFAGDSDGTFNVDEIAEDLQSHLPGIINFDTATMSDTSRGTFHHLLIQTIPSVANGLQLIYRTGAALDVDPEGNVTATTYIEFITRVKAISDGFVLVPDCPSVAPEA